MKGRCHDQNDYIIFVGITFADTTSQHVSKSNHLSQTTILLDLFHYIAASRKYRTTLNPAQLCDSHFPSTITCHIGAFISELFCWKLRQSWESIKVCKIHKGLLITVPCLEASQEDLQSLSCSFLPQGTFVETGRPCPCPCYGLSYRRGQPSYRLVRCTTY